MAEENTRKLNDQEEARRVKMNALKEQGIDPFGHAYARKNLASELFAQFGDKSVEELEEI